MADPTALELWRQQREREDKRAQDFIHKMRQRIREIEFSLPDDFESTEYIKGVNQIKSIDEVISIITTQQHISVQLTEVIGKDYLWSLEKETELAQTKLELIRMKNNNAFLLKLCTKLDGKRIIPPVNNF